MNHYSAAAIAELVKGHKITGLPASERRVRDMAERQDWPSRPRAGQKGGGGVEYPESVLPLALKLKINEGIPLFIADGRPAANPVRPAVSVRANSVRLPVLSPTGLHRLHARQAVLHLFMRLRYSLNLATYKAAPVFAAAWNTRTLPDIDDSLYNVIPHLSTPTLKRWVAAKRAYDFASLAGHYGNRKGAGIIETQGLVNHIAALVTSNAHLTAKHIRDFIRIDFPNIAPPSTRVLQRWVSHWKRDNAILYTQITNPDKAKSKYRPAFGKAYGWVSAPNQLWEIDASPADALTLDGRYTLYSVIDIYTRRMLVEVSKTPKASAALKLIRRAVTEWGVPDTIRTDNGKDFIAHWFKHTLSQLGIYQDIAPPFCPEKKAVVERAFGTIQRDLMPTCKGFIGHNVKDRKQIEARKTFAARLGEKPERAFCVELTPEDLQKACDDWATHIYANRKHSGIGVTPTEKLAGWAGTLRQIDNKETLHVLFAPLADNHGLRIVTHQGVRVEGTAFIATELSVEIGRQVLVRHDPEDFGKIWLFSADGSEFICEALNAEKLGYARKDIAEGAKTYQTQEKQEYKTEIKKLSRKLTAKDMNAARVRLYQQENKIHTLPRVSEKITSPNLEAAGEAVQGTTSAAPFETVFDLESARGWREGGRAPSNKDNATSRFARARGLEGRIEKGENVSTQDSVWLGGYQTMPEYKARKRMLEDFGETAFAL